MIIREVDHAKALCVTLLSLYESYYKRRQRGMFGPRTALFCADVENNLKFEKIFKNDVGETHDLKEKGNHKVISRARYGLPPPLWVVLA